MLYSCRKLYGSYCSPVFPSISPSTSPRLTRTPSRSAPPSVPRRAAPLPYPSASRRSAPLPPLTVLTQLPSRRVASPCTVMYMRCSVDATAATDVLRSSSSISQAEQHMQLHPSRRPSAEERRRRVLSRRVASLSISLGLYCNCTIA